MIKLEHVMTIAALACSAGCLDQGQADDPTSPETETVARVSGHSGRFVSYGGKCLDITNNGTADRTPVQLWDCTGAAEQTWDSPQSEWLTINASAPSYKVLDAPYTTDFSTTWIFSYWGGANQFWTVPWMEIRGVGDKCADVPYSNDGSIVWLFSCWGGSNQHWTFDRDSGQIRTLDGRCLATTSLVNNSAIVVRTCDGSSSQHWYLGDNGQLTAGGGMCLDVPDGNTADRTPLQLYQCSGVFSHAHSFYINGPIQNYQSRKCLQVHQTSSGPDYHDGSQPELYSCNGSATQNWAFHWN